jgi:hypothetical protein
MSNWQGPDQPTGVQMSKCPLEGSEGQANGRLGFKGFIIRGLKSKTLELRLNRVLE